MQAVGDSLNSCAVAGISSVTYNTHLVPLQLEGLELHGDAILRGGHHLPHAVLVGRILFGPAWRADGAVQLGEEAAAGRCRHRRQVGRVASSLRVFVRKSRKTRGGTGSLGGCHSIAQLYNYNLSHSSRLSGFMQRGVALIPLNDGAEGGMWKSGRQTAHWHNRK